MAWVRLHTDIIDDQKVAKLPPKSYKIFTFLLCFAKELDQNGVIDKPTKDIAWRLRVRTRDVIKTIEQLIELKILSNEEYGLRFVNWDKRQYSESYSRVTKHREKKQECNANVTDEKRPIQNRTDTETETEKDITTSVSNDKIVFDQEKGKFENISSTLKEKWGEANPAVDIPQQIAKAEAWVISNPKNRKRNWERFLSNWMMRAQEKAPRVDSGSAKITTCTKCDLYAEGNYRLEGKVYCRDCYYDLKEAS